MLDDLDNLEIRGEDDSEGEGESKYIDEEYIGNVHLMVLLRTLPLDTTTETSYPCFIIRCVFTLQYCYLTPRAFWPKVPNPSIGGKETKNEYVQMKMRVNRVDMGVDKRNCLSLVTIMYLCRANTDRVTIDWIPEKNF